MLKFEDLDRLTAMAGDPWVNDMFTPEKCKPLAEKLVESFRGDKCFLSYLQHVKARGRNTRPEHAIGERMYAAFICAGIAAGRTKGTAKISGAGVQDLPDMLGLGIATTILGSQLYLWSDEMEHLADAAPLPKHTVSRDVLPAPVMFWSRETSYGRYSDRVQGDYETNWILIFHCGTGFRVIQDVCTGPDDLKIIGSDMPYGEIWPDDYGDNTEQVGRVLKRFAFLRSPYIDTQRKGLPRHLRRQMERAGQTPPKDEVRVVVLRRRAGKKSESGAQSQPVDWQHQWWVGAHYRAQWYPSIQAHRVIWIAPYLKGPEGKPIVEKMYAVRR